MAQKQKKEAEKAKKQEEKQAKAQAKEQAKKDKKKEELVKLSEFILGKITGPMDKLKTSLEHPKTKTLPPLVLLPLTTASATFAQWKVVAEEVTGGGEANLPGRNEVVQTCKSIAKAQALLDNLLQ